MTKEELDQNSAVKNRGDLGETIELEVIGKSEYYVSLKTKKTGSLTSINKIAKLND